MLNQVILIGRTTHDVELKETANGRAYGIVTIATARSFKNQETDSYDTDFLDVSLWGITAENVAKHVGRGSAISIRGRVANRLLDFPGEQTVKTIRIIGEQVKFIQIKPPSTTAIDAKKDDEFTVDDFPTSAEFDEEFKNL